MTPVPQGNTNRLPLCLKRDMMIQCTRIITGQKEETP